LVALDDLALRSSYVLLDAPLPVKSYVATLQLSRVSEPHQTFAEWLAFFDCAVADEARLRESIHEVFLLGLQTLQRRFL
jgi:hypothetical protein